MNNWKQFTKKHTFSPLNWKKLLIKIIMRIELSRLKKFCHSLFRQVAVVMVKIEKFLMEVI